jgi:low affinity Fe/Cu permease
MVAMPDTSTEKRNFFLCFAKAISEWTGSATAFCLATGFVLLWGVTGPLFQFSDTWQLVINTVTGIVTFLMVFLIQNAQNRDSKAMQLKLDELLRCTEGAHTVLLDLEELNDKELKAICLKYQKIASEARHRLRTGGDDTNIPDVEIHGHHEEKDKK